MKSGIKYAAISRGERDYRVAYTHAGLDWVNLGDCRTFTTFDEANQVALDIAKGKYDWKPGQYINMR
jgi:hypothetical protein